MKTMMKSSYISQQGVDRLVAGEVLPIWVDGVGVNIVPPLLHQKLRPGWVEVQQVDGGWIAFRAMDVKGYRTLPARPAFLDISPEEPERLQVFLGDHTSFTTLMSYERFTQLLKENRDDC